MGVVAAHAEGTGKGDPVGSAALESLRVTLKEARLRLTMLDRREMALHEGRVFAIISHQEGPVPLAAIADRRRTEILQEREALEERIRRLEAQASGADRHLAY